MSNWGIILAAGSGVRFGAPKAFIPLNGKPMLWYSLEAFEKSTEVNKVGVICREEDQQPVKSLIHDFKFKKIDFVAPGGQERQDSVVQGLNALSPDAAVVAVHDAARPLITAGLIDAVITKAGNDGAALAAVPTKDTVKICDHECVRETLKRELLWSAQTPQAFKKELLQKALERAKKESFYGTDCSSLVERLGVLVHVVAGLPENIKITTFADLVMAEALLKERLRI